MRQHAPATHRNRDAILEVLRTVLPRRGKVLEIASGTGEHAVHFAANLPGIEWQPSDPDPVSRTSIDAYREAADLPNLLRAVEIDVRQQDWGPAAEGVAAIVCINMIHIAPWSCCEGLVRGAAKILSPDAPLVTYGPYRFDGEFTAPSNARFDASLRSQNPEWGVRDLVDVTRVARDEGLTREQVIDMPANNHIVVFRLAPS